VIGFRPFREFDLRRTVSSHQNALLHILGNQAFAP